MMTISERKRKITLVVYQECLAKSNKLELRKIGDHRSGILPNSRLAPNTGLASKLRKRSSATAGKLSRLFDIGSAKSETLKETMVRYSFE
jgi:hypothetical protein